jgi:hypothetical protein
MDTETWVEVRDRSGRLLFKYNPFTNTVEIKKGGGPGNYTLIKLDEIRKQHGVLFGQEYPVQNTYPSETR